MGLFVTLLNASQNPSNATPHSEEVDGATSTRTATKISRQKPSSSEELPTVVQLFTNHPIRVAAVDTAAVAAAELVDSNSNKSKQQQLLQPKKEASYRLYLQQAQRQASSFAPLHYAAVQCRSSATSTENRDTTTMTPRGGNKIKDVATHNAQLQTPDLGIWSCRVASNTSMADAMLPLATATCQSNHVFLFCLVVNLTHPETVEPTITTLQQALVRYLIQHSFSPSTEHKQPLETTVTTSLYQLKTVQFGLADKDQKSAERLLQSSPTPDEEGDKEVQIAMQICAVMPSSTTDPNSSETNDFYRRQQQFQLLTYHLRKYAAAVNASLVFVESTATNIDTTPENSSNHHHENSATTAAADPYDTATTSTREQQQHQQPTVTTEELPIIWKALASGKPVWKYDSVEALLVEAGGGGSSSAILASPSLDEAVVTDEENEGSTTSTTTSGYSLIYGPDNHNPELIETVLLRNAVYPGHWDAATDSIWKVFSPPPAALPPTTIPKTTSDGISSSGAAGNDGGDQAWLKELRDSVAPSDSSTNNNNPLQTPPAKTGSNSNANHAGTKPDTATKTPNDAAVSSFFEGLLK